MKRTSQAVHHVITLRTQAPKREKVGRNAPCPCGSGRKYKKCCANKPLQTTTPSSPEELMGLVPVPDEDAMREAMMALSSLIQEDPELKEALVLEGDLPISEFIAREEAAKGLSFDDIEADERDLWAATYIARHVATARFKRYLDVLEQALERHIHNNNAIRALLYGIMILETLQITPNDPQSALNPLALTLFYHTLAIGDGVALNRADELVRTYHKDILDSADPRQYVDHLVQSLQSDDPQAYQALKSLALRASDATTDAIVDGSFPVYLPLPSLMPMYVDIMAYVDSDEKVPDDFFTTHAEALHEEDIQLYIAFLKEWLAEHPKAPRRDTAELMLTTLEFNPQLGGWGELLLIAFLKMECCTVFGEEDNTSILADGQWDIEGLQRAASVYEEKGYPALAQRTREIAEKLVSTPVPAKLQSSEG